MASKRGALLRKVIECALERLEFDYPGKDLDDSATYSEFVLSEKTFHSPDYQDEIRITLLRSAPGYLNKHNDRLEVSGVAINSAIGAKIPWGIALHPQELSQPDHTISFGSSLTRSICNDTDQLEKLIANIKSWQEK